MPVLDPQKCIAFTKHGPRCKRAPQKGTSYCSSHKNYPAQRATQEKILQFLEETKVRLHSIAEMRHRYCPKDADLPPNVVKSMNDKRQRMDSLLYDPRKGLEALMKRHQTQDVTNDFSKIEKDFAKVSKSLLSLINDNCKGRKTAPYVVPVPLHTPEQVVEMVKRGDDDSRRYVIYLMTFTKVLWDWCFWGLVKTPAVISFIYHNQGLVILLAVFIITNQPWIGKHIPGVRSVIEVIETMVAFMNSTKESLREVREQMRHLFTRIAKILKYSNPDTMIKWLTDKIMLGRNRKQIEKQLDMGDEMWQAAKQSKIPKLAAPDPSQLEDPATWESIGLENLHMFDPSMRYHTLEGILIGHRGSGQHYYEDAMPVWTVLSLAAFMLRRLLRF